MPLIAAQAATGELVRQWDAHFKGVNSVRFSDDDIYVVTGGEDSLVHVWVLGEYVPAPCTQPGSFAAIGSSANECRELTAAQHRSTGHEPGSSERFIVPVHVVTLPAHN